MTINLRFELHPDFVEEIMDALGILDDDYDEIVIGQRGDKEFMCDLDKAEDVISEYISDYCEMGLTVTDVVNKITSSEEEKDILFKMLCEVKSNEL